jgi:protein-tyrosine phosphatase
MFLDKEQARVVVDELSIRTRLDLRRSSEIASGTSAALSEVERRVENLPVLATGTSSPRPRKGETTLALRYSDYLENSADSLARVAMLLSRADYLPALVHCTAGKDRTGVVCAVVLSAAGVTEDAVVADYAATSDHIAGVFDQLRGNVAYAQRLAEIPEEMSGAAPETMQEFLEALRSQYGGARGYLRGAGVKRETLERLETVLLEHSPV